MTLRIIANLLEPFIVKGLTRVVVNSGGGRSPLSSPAPSAGEKGTRCASNGEMRED